MNIIGARIIKTGISVAITMFICNKFKLEPAVFGAVSAVINLQPSIYTSYKTTINQVKVHILGVLAGIIFGYIFGSHPLSMGLVTILIIYTYKRLNLQSGILMGVVAAIFILSASPDQFLSHAFNRSAVIFIGLAVSVLTNIILWPPRYEKKLLEKIRETNAAAVEYFCHAISDFANLDKREVHFHNAQKEILTSLIIEARQLAEYIQNDWKMKHEIELILDYIHGISDKADQIYEIIPGRINRRAKYNNPIISEEFRAILNLLESGCFAITKVNENIRAAICDRAKVNPEKINEQYWTKLTDLIDEWNDKLNNSYYVHGLIDVAVVANDIRWVAREGKRILKTCN